LDPDVTSLPRLIPLFPLPNVVLFPKVPLPLHVFEPRQEDDHRSRAKIIGMTWGGWWPAHGPPRSIHGLPSRQ
jgi:Lon protease-like protein